MSAIGKVVAVIVGLCLLVACAVAGGAPAVASDDPSSVASSTIPAALLALFQQASAASSCGVPWTLLAAVAHTESDFDPTRHLIGWSRGSLPVRTRHVRRLRPTDSHRRGCPSQPLRSDRCHLRRRPLPVLARDRGQSHLGPGRLQLRQSRSGLPGRLGGVRRTGAGHSGQLHGSRKHSDRHAGTSSGVPTVVQAAAVTYAESQIGTPYVWGGTSPKTGFDCSGLVVWAYGLAGVVVPRVANDQWHDEPHVAMDQLVPGDLVFFGTGDYADHVGIYVGGSAMVDAPYTGADVRIDTIPMTVGAAWGSQVVLGAADPVAQSAVA